MNSPSATLQPVAAASLASLSRSGAADPHQQLQRTAQILVSGTFFGTLLKQMRSSPFKSDVFGGGRGEQAFGPLYDQTLAERLARGSGQRLVNTIVKRIERSAAYKRQSRLSKEGSNPSQEARDVTTTRRA